MPLLDVERRSRGELEHPRAAELADLLLERHPAEQIGDPLGDRQRRVTVGGIGADGRAIDGAHADASQVSARLSLDELGRQHDLVRSVGDAVEQIDEQSHGFFSHRLDRLVDRRQRRVGERRLRNVVEPDHRHVLRHRQSEGASDVHRLDRRQVVGGEDRRRRIGESSSWRAGSRDVSSSYPPTRTRSGSKSMPAVARASW